MVMLSQLTKCHLLHIWYTMIHDMYWSSPSMMLHILYSTQLVYILYVGALYMYHTYDSCLTNLVKIIEKKKESGSSNVNISEFQQQSLSMLGPLISFKVILCFELGLILLNFNKLFLVFSFYIQLALSRINQCGTQVRYITDSTLYKKFIQKTQARIEMAVCTRY